KSLQPRANASPASHLPRERSRAANGSHTRKATPPHPPNSSQKSARHARARANQRARATQPQPPQSSPVPARGPHPHKQTHSTADPAACSIPQSAPNEHPPVPQATPPAPEPVPPSPQPKENSSHS